jgi:hypothetical protein
MTPNQLRSEIQNLIVKLWSANLIRDSNLPVIENLGNGKALVTWKSGDRTLFADGYDSSWQQYLSWLTARQYTVLLADYAFLQITYTIKRGEIIKHRLVYYPCPIEIDRAIAAELGIIEYFDLLNELEILNRLRLETPIRFEFDPEAAKIGHPASHLHLSKDSCRIPVYAPLSLGRFVRFVFGHFYPLDFQNHEFLKEWQCREVNRCIESLDTEELHLTCVTE